MIETPSFSIEGGAIVPVTNVSARKKQEVSDILTWVECFTRYLSVVSNSFPARARDLLAYMALIIRMAKRYSGKCWSNYDRAFHLEATASNLRDWSQMKADLYSYHTSVDTSNKTVAPQRAQRREPRGNQHAEELCRSWNAGSCSSPRETCRFRHNCGKVGYGGPNRKINCTNNRDRSPTDRYRARRAPSK